MRREVLDQMVAPFLKEAGLRLVDFQERVIANLQTGGFLLLIVGDRISPNVAFLSEAIHGSPGLDFTIGLIELHMYTFQPNADWPLLIVPDIVGKTVETTRGVIKVQYTKEKPSIHVEISPQETEPKTKGKVTPEIFLQKTPNDLRPVYEHWFNVWQDKQFYVYWGSVGFSLRVHIKGVLHTIIKAYPEWVLTLIRESDADKIGVVTNHYQTYVEAVSEIPQVGNILADGTKQYITHEDITEDELMIILEATTEFARSVQD